jgi:DNA polymerase-3 subunit epsilon
MTEENLREICFDTETTGLDPRDGHKVIEIGCVELINKVKTGKTFHAYINPQREVPNDAFKIHGISTEFLQDKPAFSEIAQGFVDFVKDAKLIAHNAAFDMKFINFELRQCDLEIIERSWVIDSLQIARNKFPGASNSLDALCKRFGIDLSKRIKHGALLDADLLADIYLELSGGSQVSMFGNQNKDEITAENSEIRDKKRIAIPARNFALNEEEILLHQEFIKTNFKENPWE